MSRSVHSLRKTMLLMVSLLVISIILSACSPNLNQSKMDIAMAPVRDLPRDVQNAPTTVREAYQFAVANPEVLKQIPCYCGCGSVGHTSNYSCYVQSDEVGNFVFDTHALGCGICVDIARDAMQMYKNGKPMAEIGTAIADEYSQYGPSNLQ